FDKDGKFIYSEIRSVRLTANGLIVGVYPNPIKDFANVAIDMEQDAEATLTVNDALGKQVQTMQVQLFKGPNIKKINMASHASGSYLLILKTKAETKTVGLVKTN
ncbi:MAG: T9SS type A sorting domain-containing protein, partial [Aquabacterium sp.]|nr:T9SS type A sorting domain-containing protein [Ferruginibacter sp.]